MDGILLVDKPVGWTSFDAVAKVRGVLQRTQSSSAQASEGQRPKRPRVGHTGTLDPLASGLLVLLVGGYTKRATELTKLDKTYQVAMELGQTSSTGDKEGEITAVSGDKPSVDAVKAALEGFRGEIEQVPPIHSAIKINGQRAYKLARAGKEVKMEPRTVTIHEITDVKYDYPTVSFTAKVSSGTYIRSLVEDIGKALATGAYMSSLRRTEVGKFKLQDAITMPITSIQRSDLLQ